MRGLATVLILMAVATRGATGPTAAASPSGGDPAHEIVVAVRVVAPCPSVLGCPVAVRLAWPDGTIQDPAPLDGADTADPTDATETRFAVPAGPVRVDLVTRMITERATDGDLLTATAEDLAACSLELTVPERTGSVTVTGTVAYGWPAPSPGTLASPMTPDWSCELALPTADREGDGAPAAAPVVIPIQATVCDETGRRTADDCQAAIRAAATLRLALRQATVAVAVPDCPDTAASCAFPTYAVAFASREGDAWPWSETFLVSLDPTGATVVPWSWSQAQPPVRLAATQESLSPLAGGRLGASVAIPTSPPVPEGSEAVCLTALTAGVLTRHPSSGVVLANEEGFTRVTWPAGWTSREAPEGFVLVDASGETVAREGQVIRVGGGETAPGEWLTCGDISLPFLI